MKRERKMIDKDREKDTQWERKILIKREENMDKEPHNEKERD